MFLYNGSKLESDLDILKREIKKADYEKVIEPYQRKINELEKVYTSRDSKTMKWSKLKSILIWLADKGTDVAITLIPVIYQILNQ